MSNFVDLTPSSGEEECNRSHHSAGHHISGIGYTGLPPRRQGYSYSHGDQDPRRRSMPFLLPSVAQVVANAPAAYGFPPPPQQGLDFARTKLAPLASSPPAKFEEMTGGRLHSPPPNPASVALSTPSESSSFRQYVNSPPRPPIPRAAHSPGAQLHNNARSLIEDNHHTGLRPGNNHLSSMMQNGTRNVTLSDKSPAFSPGKRRTIGIPIDTDSSTSDRKSLTPSLLKVNKNNIKRPPLPNGNHEKLPKGTLRSTTKENSGAVSSPSLDSPSRGQSSYLAKVLQPVTGPQSISTKSSYSETLPKDSVVKTTLDDVKIVQDKGSAKAKSAPKKKPSLKSRLIAQTESPVPLSPDDFQRYLRTFIKSIRADHEYYVKSRLAQARQSSKISPMVYNKSLRKIPRHGTDETQLSKRESPFAHLAALRPEPPSAPRSTQKIGRLCQFLPKAAKPGNETTHSYCWETFQPSDAAIPTYGNHISTRRNILVEDDKDRTYLPYIGEDFDPDLDFLALEKVIERNQSRYHRMNALAEKSNIYAPYTEEILSHLGCDIESVLQYLLNEKKPVPLDLPREYESIWRDRDIHIQDGYYQEIDDSDTDKLQEVNKKRPQRQWKQVSENIKRTTNGRKMAAASMACDAFLKVTGISLWHVVKQSKIAMQAAAAEKTRPETEQNSTGRKSGCSSPETNLLSTYADLGCLVCKGHECPGHGEYEDDDDDDEKNIRLRVNHKPCSPRHVEHEIPDTDTSQEPLEHKGRFPDDLFGLNEDETISGKTATGTPVEDALAETDLCSEDCFWLKSNRSKLRRKDSSLWSEEDLLILNTLRAAYENDRRGPCMIAGSLLTKKSCTEIFHKLLSTEARSENGFLRSRNDGSPSQFKTPHRRPLEHWHENFKTHLHHERQPFMPCNHSGPCDKDSNCDCFKLNITCEKSCACASDCSRRFWGCLCATRGKLCWQNQNCECFKLNRECDPDLCRTCGVHEVLDPANRYREDILQGRCANSCIQRGIPKRTLLGPSKLLASANKSGWGLYMGEACKKGDYIGEYVGEIVSRTEAEKRGTIYDRLDMSYLFDLNETQTLDSTRFGNKTRFINHQPDRTINCYARTMFCNTVHRIGMFASKDIAIGEELFFNYGEGFASKVVLITRGCDGADDTQMIRDRDVESDSLSSWRYAQNSRGTLSKNGRRIGRPPKTQSAAIAKLSPTKSVISRQEGHKPAHKRKRSEAMFEGSADDESADFDSISVALRDATDGDEDGEIEAENESESSFAGSFRLPSHLTLASPKRLGSKARSVSSQKGENIRHKQTARKSMH